MTLPTEKMVRFWLVNQKKRDESRIVMIMPSDISSDIITAIKEGTRKIGEEF